MPAPRRLSFLALLAVLAVAVLVLGGLQAGLDTLRREGAGEAAWIWAGEGSRDTGARAFYAVRDFDLEADGLGVDHRLIAGGGPEWILWLNGRRLGADGEPEGLAVATWSVGDLLRPGANRLVAELRSPRGQGAFLARLEKREGADGRWNPVLATDERWRIVRAWRPGLIGGTLPVEAMPVETVGEAGTRSENGDGDPGDGVGAGPAARSEAPRVWGRPPLGRGGVIEVPEEDPRWLETLEPPGPGAPLLVRPAREVVLGTIDDGLEAGEETPLVSTRFDLGRPVAGWLVLRFAEAPPGSPPIRALVAAGVELPEPGTMEGARVAVVAPGGVLWRDTRPRRVRHVEVLSTAPVEVLAIEVVGAGVELASEPEGTVTGLFGWRVPRQETPVERSLRRALRRALDEGLPEASPREE